MHGAGLRGLEGLDEDELFWVVHAPRPLEEQVAVPRADGLMPAGRAMPEDEVG